MARASTRPPCSVIALFDAIRAVHAAGTAVLLVEQNVTMALEVAQRAYLLEEGRTVAEGPPESIYGNPRLRRAYLGVAAP